MAINEIIESMKVNKKTKQECYGEIKKYVDVYTTHNHLDFETQNVLVRMKEAICQDYLLDDVQFYRNMFKIYCPDNHKVRE